MVLVVILHFWGGGPRNCDEGSWVLMPLCLVVDFAYGFLFTRVWSCVIGDCRETNLGKRAIMPGLILVCNWCKGLRCGFSVQAVMSRFVMSGRVMLCYFIACHVMSCHVTSRRVTSCHVMSCLRVIDIFVFSLPWNYDEGSWVRTPLCLVVDLSYGSPFTRAWS